MGADDEIGLICCEVYQGVEPRLRLTSNSVLDDGFAPVVVVGNGARRAVQLPNRCRSPPVYFAGVIDGPACTVPCKPLCPGVAVA